MYLYLFCCTAYYMAYQLLGTHPLQTILYPHTSSIVTKEYRIVNTIKAVTLGVISPSATFVLYQTLSPNTEPHIYLLYFFGATYSSLDMSALVYNPNCHMSTTIHHVLVQFLYAYCYWVNFNMNTLAKGISVYAVFSCYAYMVNYRLAIRFMNHKYENMINIMCLIIYALACFCNWGIQLYLLCFDMPESYIIEKVIYGGLIAMIMNDDVFLMKFLAKSCPNRIIPCISNKRSRSV